MALEDKALKLITRGPVAYDQLRAELSVSPTELDHVIANLERTRSIRRVRGRFELPEGAAPSSAAPAPIATAIVVPPPPTADEEVEAIMKRVQLAMQLALLTGQRQGDIIAFRWTDVRETTLDGRTFNELHVWQSKTSKRLAIEITPDLERVLDACWQLEGGGQAGSEYVLPTRTGKPFTSEGFRAAWQRVRLKWERQGGENLHFHDIRALAATKCKTLELAQQLLGHTSSAMTRRVYRRGIERVKPLQLGA